MEILVTGATGFVGPHLIAKLSSQGHHVRALALPTEDTTSLQRQGITIHRGDVCHPETLITPFRRVDTVFNLAAAHGLWRPRQEYHDVNVAGVENVCRAALAAGVRRMVHVSSWSVYGMALGQEVHEGFPLRPVPDIYSITKAQGDQLVQQYIARDKLPAAIIRPGTMFGPGDRINFGRMADRIVAGKTIILGSGRNVLPFVYVTDAVQGMILAATQEVAVGQAYNIANDRPLTQEQIWHAIAQDIGAAPPRIRVPYWVVYSIAFVAEQAARSKTAKRQPLITRLGVKMFGGQNRYSIDKARRELGYVPEVSVRDGLRIAAEWYVRRHRESAEADAAAEAA